MNGTASFKKTLSVILVVFLSVLPLVFLAWIFEEGEPGSFFGTFTYVFSGQFFHQGWNRIHAGTALDQPTIGKWYFWFTTFTVFGLSYMAVIKRFCLRCSTIRYWIFMTGLTVLCLFLICLLTIPFWWLIQYIRQMGWTDKRLYGLLYGIAGYLGVLTFYVWSVRFKRKQANQEVYHGEMSAL